MKTKDLDILRNIYDIFNEDKHARLDSKNLEFTKEEFIPEIERPDGPYKIGGMGSYALDQQRLNKQSVATKPTDKRKIGNPSPHPDVVNVDFYTGKVWGNNIDNVTVTFPGFNSYAQFVKPLEQGGGGATKKNSSEQTAQLPKWLFDQHMAEKRIA